MTEDQLRRRLRDDGLTDDEIEDEIDNLASDWYDNRKDEQYEDEKP